MDAFDEGGGHTCLRWVCVCGTGTLWGYMSIQKNQSHFPLTLFQCLKWFWPMPAAFRLAVGWWACTRILLTAQGVMPCARAFIWGGLMAYLPMPFFSPLCSPRKINRVGEREPFSKGVGGGLISSSIRRVCNYAERTEIIPWRPWTWGFAQKRTLQLLTVALFSLGA